MPRPEVPPGAALTTRPGAEIFGSNAGDFSSIDVPAAKQGHCYCCSHEALVVECEDFEFRCLQCGSTSVECFESDGSRSVPPPPVPTLGPVQMDPATGVAHVAHAAVPPRPTRSSARRVRPRSFAPHLQNRRSEGMGAADDVGVDRASRRHVGVICDGCNARDFGGTRYRCLHCRDYDLCSSCYALRGEFHPRHPFETIRAPRSQVAQLMADLMVRASNPPTVVAIIEIGVEDGSDMRNGLDDADVAWWLAQDQRLANVDTVVRQDSTWTCPICSEGAEAECENGWVVRICTDKGRDRHASTESDSTVASDGDLMSSSPTSAESESVTEQQAGVTSEEASSSSTGHIFHEGCLRRWLLKKNSCPVCRHAPVVPEPLAATPLRAQPPL